MNLYLNCKDNPITFNKKNYLLRAARRLGLDYIKDYTGGEAEYVLNIEPFDFVKGSKWTGIWEIDILINPAQGQHWDDSDNVFFAIGPVPKNDKYIYLPQACDPYLHKPNSEEKDSDFILCGTNSGENAIYKERDRVIALLETKFKYRYYGKNKAPEEYVKILNSAKVQFVRSMEVEGKGEIAQRFFECLAIGATLTNYTEDLEKLGLEEGTDYMYYKTDEEMISKMEKLLADGSEVARNGRKKALLYHTYENRLMTILNTIYENKGS